MDIKIPALGESITEARIVRWLKRDGETVKLDEPIVEIETDKASDSIPAPADGALHITIKADQTAAVGAVIGAVESAKTPASRFPARHTAAKEKVNNGRPKTAAPLARRANEKESPAAPSARRASEGESRASEGEPPAVPLARRASEGESPALPSTKRASEEKLAQSASQGEKPARETRERMSPIRQRIAERLLAAQQTTATLTTFNEADMSAVTDVRARFKESFKEKNGVGLGLMSFFVKATVEALKTFPIVNARIDGNDIIWQHFYDVGVAVSTDRGLFVPILRDADRLSFADIEKRIVELAALVRDGKIEPAHLRGGTFTITNGGIFGSLLSTPLLNPPQAAILGMHAIQKRPIAVANEIVVRPMMNLALTYDHRLIDGRDAVQFLVRVKDLVENPLRFLLET